MATRMTRSRATGVLGMLWEGLVDLFTLRTVRRRCLGSGESPNYSKPAQRRGHSVVACRVCGTEVRSKKITKVPRHR